LAREWSGITPRSGAEYWPVVHTGSGTSVKLLATPFTHCCVPGNIMARVQDWD
ncbi:uncharacterized protein C8R40DRAFT_1089113, partial [Lentinula edodes]|uniref:uncharacterized protein n=1 Tax=Lentinula edodes TaxID=5353 RepID=UPI001E8D3C29